MTAPKIDSYARTNPPCFYTCQCRGWDSHSPPAGHMTTNFSKLLCSTPPFSFFQKTKFLEKQKMSENTFPYYGEFPRLNLLQRLVLQVRKCVFVEYRTPEGYQESVPVYVVKCRRHGLYLDTPHGFSGYFNCRDCLAELHVQQSMEVHA